MMAILRSGRREEGVPAFVGLSGTNAFLHDWDAYRRRVRPAHQGRIRSAMAAPSFGGEYEENGRPDFGPA